MREGGRSMNKYNHSCISVALDFDKRNWILLDFSSVHNAKASCESLNDITSYTVFAIDYEEDFVNTVNRISPNELHYNKNFIDYIRLHHKLSTSEIETIYSKLIQAKVKGYNMQYKRKEIREKNFNDCREKLFNYAWKKYRYYLQGSIDNPKTETDIVNWIDTIISEIVNNPRSKFHIYG